MSLSTEPTRGERNNNPGNLDYHAGTMWQGLIGIETVPNGYNYTPRFCHFDTLENGVRAIAKTLLTYYRSHQCDSVRKIITRWAPPTENNFAAYMNDVAHALSVGADQVIDVEDPAVLRPLTAAIIRHENGRCLVDDATLTAAVASALA